MRWKQYRLNSGAYILVRNCMVNGILFWIVDFKKVRSLEVPEGSSNRLSGSANIILLSRTLLLWTQSPVQEDIYIRFEVDKVETLNLGLVKIWGSIKVEIKSNIWVKFFRVYKAWIWCLISSYLWQKLKQFLKIFEWRSVYIPLLGPPLHRGPISRSVHFTIPYKLALIHSLF